MNIIDFTEKYLVTFISPKGEWSNGVTLQPYEKDFLTSLVENRFSINVASRQMHMSTLLCAYIAYNLIFSEDAKITLLDIRLELVSEKINKIRLIIDNYIRKTSSNLKFSIDNKKEIKLNNENRVIGVSGMDGFKGRYSDIIIIDNAAYIKNLEEVYAAFAPTVATNGKIHLVSAANDINYFYTIFSDAEIKNPFKKNSYHYSLNSFYTPEVIENSKKYLNGRDWDREMEMKFFITERPQRNRTLQVRVDGETYIEVTKRLVQLDMNVSEYLYDLIKKDLQGA